MGSNGVKIISEQKKSNRTFFIKKVKKPKYGKGKPCPNCGTEMALQDYMRADFRGELVNPWRCPECGYLHIDYLKDSSEALTSV